MSPAASMMSTASGYRAKRAAPTEDSTRSSPDQSVARDLQQDAEEERFMLVDRTRSLILHYGTAQRTLTPTSHALYPCRSHLDTQPSMMPTRPYSVTETVTIRTAPDQRVLKSEAL